VLNAVEYSPTVCPSSCCAPPVPAESDTSSLLKERHLKCDDVCLSLKRAKDFGAAVFSGSGGSRAASAGEVCPYPDELLVHTYQNPGLVSKCETKIRAFIADRSAKTLDLPAMAGGQRGFMHQLASLYGLHSECVAWGVCIVLGGKSASCPLVECAKCA
jgi:hypothetical protein